MGVKQAHQTDRGSPFRKASGWIGKGEGLLAESHWIIGPFCEAQGRRGNFPFTPDLLKGRLSRGKYPIIFFGTKVFFAVWLPLLFFLTRLVIHMNIPSLTFLLISILLAMMGFYLPNLWIKMRISNRKEKMQQGLPDALDLMVVCVEAGTGLDAAINRVGEEMKLSNKVLSEEFRLMSMELRAGKQRRNALKNLALRTDLEDVSSLVTLLIQTEKFGTSLAQALRVHSDSMRTKRFQKAEEIAAKLPVKLMFPLVLFIFPSIFVDDLRTSCYSDLQDFVPRFIGRLENENGKEAHEVALSTCIREPCSLFHHQLFK